jgi:plastocyanin
VHATTVRGSVQLMASKHRDYSGVVVWLEPVNGAMERSFPARPAQMIQKNKTFTPHVVAIPLGGSVSFPNLDPIFHNAFSNFNGQIFDVGLYKPGSSRTVTFKRAGVVRVFCNIHPQMSAVIAVLDTPYFAVTDRGGSFAIDNVPPGEYQFHVFHERAAQETLDSMAHKITVETAALELPPLSISEIGYLPVPHKNKYNKDYPPVIEEQPAYPGAKK